MEEMAKAEKRCGDTSSPTSPERFLESALALSFFLLLFALLAAPLAHFLAPLVLRSPSRPVEQGALVRLAEGSPVLTEFMAFSDPTSRRYTVEALDEVLLKVKAKGYGYAVRHVVGGKGDEILNQAAYCAYEEGGPDLYLLLRRIVAEEYPRLPAHKEGVERVLRERGFPVERIASCFRRSGGHPQQKRDMEAYREAHRLSFLHAPRTPLFYQGQERLHQGYRTRRELLIALGLGLGLEP